MLLTNAAEDVGKFSALRAIYDSPEFVILAEEGVGLIEQESRSVEFDGSEQCCRSDTRPLSGRGR